MLAFLVRRVGVAAVVLAVFSFVSFVLFARLQRPPRPPVLGHYWSWLKGVPAGSSFHAVLHASTHTLAPQAAILTALAHTALLLTGALLLVVAGSVLLAAAAARWRGGGIDLTLRGTSYLVWAVPAFLLALIVEEVVNAIGGPRGLGPFPIAGWPGSCPAGMGVDAGTISPCPAAGSGLVYLGNLARYLVLPTITLAIGFIGLHGRYLRSSLVEALDSPYITTARAKGLPERTVIRRHALRASLATFTSALLADFGAVFGAALAVDYVFRLGGLGTLFLNEFNPTTGAFDLYSMEALVLVTAILVLLSSLASELAVGLLDPRVRRNR